MLFPRWNRHRPLLAEHVIATPEVQVNVDAAANLLGLMYIFNILVSRL